jgi:hypothetical protein
VKVLLVVIAENQNVVNAYKDEHGENKQQERVFQIEDGPKLMRTKKRKKERNS